MKKLLGLVFAVLAFVLTTGITTVPTAEAARVAVLPLQQDNLVKDEEDTHDYNTLYWDVATDLYKFPSFDLLGDDEIQKALPAEGLKDFSEATLKTFADKTEADLVVAMRLDELTSKGLMARREQTDAINMKGDFASYNRISGKYMHKKIYEQDEVEEVLLVRGDWRGEYFTKLAKRYMERALKLK